ncbi:hypothetical protein BCR43DRAFT_497605 [Syncephalastrum racemosum]|uniref:Uncharacterized protein n=1 Tax=Syncephalastrum racemosum TaxID=13706 RepID=A0A1X2H2L5_SYNRA|nr:hypothetical protein BCR43DRAFT_497605 [Syncephalastrum racemosum]
MEHHSATDTWRRHGDYYVLVDDDINLILDSVTDTPPPPYSPPHVQEPSIIPDAARRTIHAKPTFWSPRQPNSNLMLRDKQWWRHANVGSLRRRSGGNAFSDTIRSHRRKLHFPSHRTQPYPEIVEIPTQHNSVNRDDDLQILAADNQEEQEQQEECDLDTDTYTERYRRRKQHDSCAIM